MITKIFRPLDYLLLVVLAVLVIALFTYDCSGQLHPSTCRVAVTDRDGHNSMGSGTLTDLVTQHGNKVITSAGHVFRDRRTNWVSVTFLPKRKVVGKLVHVNMESDVAFVAVSPKDVQGVTVTPVASSKPQLREKVYAEGYGKPNNVVGVSEGVIRSLSAYSETSRGPSYLLGTTATVTQGDSGGPFRNALGELVSIISTGDVPNYSAGPRTDVLWRDIQEVGLRRAVPITGGYVCPTCPQPIQQFAQPQPIQQFAQPQPIQQFAQPTPAQPPPPVQPQIQPVRPQIEIPKLEVIITQRGETGPPGPPGAQGRPGPPGAEGKSASIDYQRLAEQVAPLIRVDQQELVQQITQAVLANTKPVEVPQALRVNIYHKITGETLFDQTYPLRGNGGVVDIKVPYEPSNIGDRSGQFQIQVQ